VILLRQRDGDVLRLHFASAYMAVPSLGAGRDAVQHRGEAAVLSLGRNE
jgi:hypothetical protein